MTDTIENVKFYTNTPGGSCPTLYGTMTDMPHLLIAGATGSGKSVVINGILYSAMFGLPHFFAKSGRQFILCDPKRVELVQYANLPHTIQYAADTRDILRALRYSIRIMEQRYQIMQSKGIRKWEWGHLYVVIDEWADLVVAAKKQVVPLVQRLTQLGRAACVHVILATQCPLAKILPTEIKVNFTNVLGLHTVTPQQSRNVIGVKGCERLPMYGYGYLQTPEGISPVQIPYVTEDETDQMIQWWKNQVPQSAEG